MCALLQRMKLHPQMFPSVDHYISSVSHYITKVLQSDNFSCRFHDDIIIVLDGEVHHLYHDSHCITFSRSWWPALPLGSSPAHCWSLEIIWSAAGAVIRGSGYNCSHTPAYSRWPCSFPPRGTYQVDEPCTSISHSHKSVWCPEKPYSRPQQDCPWTRAALPDTENRYVCYINKLHAGSDNQRVGRLSM